MKSISVVNWHPASENARPDKCIILETEHSSSGERLYFDCFASNGKYFIFRTLGSSLLDTRAYAPIRWFYQSDLREPKVQEPPDTDRVVLVTTKKGKKRDAFYGANSYKKARWWVQKSETGLFYPKPNGWQPISWREVNDDD